MRARKRLKIDEKKLALEHISELFEQADNVFSFNQDLAHRYVFLARKVQMRFNVKMPRVFKRKFCKHCYHYIRSGVNGRVRIRNGVLVLYCDNCRKFTRIPFKNKE